MKFSLTITSHFSPECARSFSQILLRRQLFCGSYRASLVTLAWSPFDEEFMKMLTNKHIALF